MKARGGAARRHIPFRAVNCPGQLGYDGGLQRHHLLPEQLRSRSCFGALFDAVGESIGFDDFRANGMLLPGNAGTALRSGLPLHRGPHGAYNAMVIERVGRIEGEWSRRRWSIVANAEAAMRIDLLQRALRRRLLDPRRTPIVLNRRVLLAVPQQQFAELDAMADALWGDLETLQPGEDAASFSSSIRLAA